MISKKEKEVLIEVLGKHYTAKVIPYLQEMEIRNEKGKDFSVDSIRMFVNGLRKNEVVELAILKLVNRTIKANKAMQMEREKLIYQ